MNYFNRLDKINSDLENRYIWDSIDRPMRPLIFELHRIGMITKFCCCGFSYQDETLDEYKTHYKWAYVHYFVSNNKKAIQNYDRLCCISGANQWGMRHPFNNNPLIDMCYKTNYDDVYRKEDGIGESIHQHEAYALSIQSLTYGIQEIIETVNDTIEIIDGNSAYENIPEWQVKPKKKFIINVKDYYEMFGKTKPATNIDRDRTDVYHPHFSADYKIPESLSNEMKKKLMKLK